MKFKKIMMVSLILPAILTVGAVSASSDMNTLSQDSADSGPVANTTIIVDDVVDTSAEFRLAPGPVDPSGGESGVALILQDENYGGEIYVDTEIDDQWEPVFSDLNIDYNSYEYDKEYNDEGIWYYIPSSLFDFNSYEDGQLFRFTFEGNCDDSDNFLQEHFRLVIYDPDTRIHFETLDDADFEAEFWEANVADHGIALGIPIHQDSSIVDNVANFTIEVNFWGDIIKTVWDKDDVSIDEEMDVYYWTTTDLGIDDRMWDIGGYVDCEITVIIMDEGDETEYYASDEITFVNSPFISSGELSPFIESEPVITFSFFPPADDLFTISIRKDGAFFANRTFKISEMDQYKEDEENYCLYLEDLGISELGEYDVSVRFTDLPRTDEAIYTSTFNVVPFVIHTFRDIEQIIDPVFAIVLPEDSEGNVIIKVNGTQVFNETLSDIGYVVFFRGDGYYIKLNDLNIVESGYYDVEMTVNAMDVTRTAATEIYVNITENTFEFKDAIYILEDIMDTYLGTPISSDNEIVLYLNGKKAATGSVGFEGLAFDYEEGYADIYGCLLPGQYQAKLVIDGVPVAEDTFEVKDNSGDIDAYINAINGEYYLNFKAPWPKCGHLWGYILNVYVDAYHPDDMFYNDTPVISLCDDEFENLLDEEWHALYIGELGPGNHFIFVEYFIENDDISLEDKDYFIRIFDIVKDEVNLTAYYAASSKELVVSLVDAVTGSALKGASVSVDVDGKEYTVKIASSGQGRMPLDDLDYGTYTATLSYKGNAKYSAATTTVDIAVKDNVDLSAVYDSSTKELVVRLVNDVTGAPLKGASVAVNINGEKYSVKINSKGEGRLSLADLGYGTYVAALSYKGNTQYNAATVDVDFAVKDAVNLTAYYASSSKELVVSLVNASSGAPLKGASVSVDIDGKSYTVKIASSGQGRVALDDLDYGTYTATLSYKGNAKYNAVTAGVDIVVKDNVDLSAVYDSATKELVVRLVNDVTGAPLKGASVTVNINGEKFTVKINSQGEGRLSLADLDQGTYVATLSYKGNAQYNAATVEVDVTVKDAVNLTAYYAASSKELVVSLVDATTGSALKGASVAVDIDGKSYTVKIASSGQGRMPLDDLDYGTYTAILSYKGNAKYNAVTTGVDIVVKDNVDLSAVYDGTTKELVVRLVNDVTGAPLKGASVAVNINGEKFNVKINSKGEGRLSLADLDKGTYAATLSYKGNAQYNAANVDVDVVVKDAASLSVVYDDGTKDLTVTLVNIATGAPLKGASVVVNINDVKYSVKITATGQGKLSLVDLPQGTYTAIASYKGNANYSPCDATADFTIN